MARLSLRLGRMTPIPEHAPGRDLRARQGPEGSASDPGGHSATLPQGYDRLGQGTGWKCRSSDHSATCSPSARPTVVEVR